MPRRLQRKLSTPDLTCKAKPQAAGCLPITGRMVQLNINDREMSGWRTWLILCVGRKFITLFSLSMLTTYKVKVNEWGLIPLKVYTPHKGTLLAVLQANTEQRTRLNMQFSSTNADLARKLIRKWHSDDAGVLCSTPL